MSDSQTNDELAVREANDGDVAALAVLRPGSGPGLHRDRLQQARNGDLSYLVVEHGAEVVGFCVLVFRRPSSWSDAADPTRLPQMVDLFVAEAARGQGIGQFFIGQVETIARRAGCEQIFIGVDPIENPRAHALYLRLGYSPLQAAPHRTRWRFVDSTGTVHRGEEWHLDLMKMLPGSDG